MFLSSITILERVGMLYVDVVEAGFEKGAEEHLVRS